MRTILLLLFCICISPFLFSQTAPGIEWQKNFGGTADDEGLYLQQTSDGGFIIGGESFSHDIDVSGNHGSSDYWIIKTDVAGNLTWQKSLGGSSSDVAGSVKQTADGGYIIAGNSKSTDGDVTGQHGQSDYWIVKTDSLGVIQWQKAIGGTQNDYGAYAEQTSDHGYIVTGYSYSNDGDATGHHGGLALSDYFIAKLDSAGAIQWTKSLGGTGQDASYAIHQTADGGYITAGYTSSNDGDVSGGHGGRDFWIVKLDNTGSITWQKCFGGSSDEFAYDIRQTTDDGFIMAGQSASNDGNVTGNHGNSDFWIVKTDASGNLTWQKSLGGTGYDYANSIEQTSEGGYVAVGLTGSANGDVTGYNGGVFFGDYWVTKLDDSGNLSWQKCLGGTNDDAGNAIEETMDGGFIVGGWSESDNGDVTSNYGTADVWIVRLSTPTVTENDQQIVSLSAFPNPTQSDFQISFPAASTPHTMISISNLMGQKVFEKEIPLNATLQTINASGWQKGMYLITISNKQSIEQKQLLIQ